MSEAKNWAVVDDATNLVVNVVSWDGSASWQPPAGCSAIDVSAIFPEPGIGWIYNPQSNTFTPPPQVYSTDPVEAPIAGGTSVVLTGSNFTGATSVTFGGKDSVFTVNSDTEISATTPQMTKAGQYQLIVSNSLQQGFPSTFTYTS